MKLSDITKMQIDAYILARSYVTLDGMSFEDAAELAENWSPIESSWILARIRKFHPQIRTAIPHRKSQ